MASIKKYNAAFQCWEWTNAAGQLHREDGPAVECDNGNLYWYFNDRRHRENGPAIEYNDGSKVWYRHGLLHREDGPAIEYTNEIKEFWVNGVRTYSPEELQIIEKEKLEREIIRKENESILI